MPGIKEQLAAHGIHARKDLGQHYLTDADAVQAIVDAAELDKTDAVLEVGPGPGVLTPLLCEQAGAVTAIELDEEILKVLKANTATLNNLTLLQGNVLNFDPAGLPPEYKLVGNLPYYITSAIIKRFLETTHRPQSITITVQAEVAERIVATPPKMSVLAVSVQLYGNPRLVHRIPKEAFWPVPRVDSAVLAIDSIGRQTKHILGALPEKDFFKVVRAGFGEKRKQLHNSLAHNLDLSHEETTRILTGVGITPVRRAETLTVAEWARLGRAYAGR